MPPGFRSTAKPECWKADYAIPNRGSAEVYLCGFTAEGSAFDALQRARAEANTVKFQASKFLVLVQWNGASREEITALVRSIQKISGSGR